MCCKNGCACFPVPENVENDADPRALQCEKQVTGLEPVISAWKANVFPLHYTCIQFHEVVGGSNKTKSPFINGLLNVSAYEWSGKRGSNPPPQPWQGCALPNELLPQEPIALFWCGRRDLNPYAFRAPEPKSGASANSATPAHRSASAEEKNGDPPEGRTPDNLIKSQVLYQLS